MSEANTQAAWQAAGLARAQRAGVLSTLSRRHAGHPFGSVVPYVVLPDGALAIYISDLAEHTKNLLADPRAALTVLDPQDLAGDAQAGPRLTLLASAAPVPEHAAAAVAARYEGYFPKAAGYRNAHDFAYFTLRCERVRYIGGFGDIHWFDGAQFPLAHLYADAEAGIVAHMNTDHADALATYWRAARGAPPEPPTLLGLDPCGMDLRAGNTLARVPFDAPVLDEAGVRGAVIAALDRARAQLAAAP